MAIRDVAKARLANLRKTGGIPMAKPKGTLMKVLSESAKQIKTRQDYEAMPEGDVKRGPR